MLRCGVGVVVWCGVVVMQCVRCGAAVYVVWSDVVCDLVCDLV